MSESNGRDPDTYSPTLRSYHQLLWSKPLPSGQMFTLDGTGPLSRYLHHQSDLGEFFLGSDAITTRLQHKASRVIEQVPADQMPTDIGYRIGSAIVFPGNQVDGKQSLNQARGFNSKIADRFDLTLECIRRHYLSESNPLDDVLNRYGDFFALFGDFAGYVEFFHLQDLVTGDGKVRFFTDFDDFTGPAVPQDVDSYVSYVTRSNEFALARSQRIAEASNTGT